LTNKGPAAWQAFTAIIKTKYVALVACIGPHKRAACCG